MFFFFFSGFQGHQLSYLGHEGCSLDFLVLKADTFFSYSLKALERHSTVSRSFNGSHNPFLLLSSKFFHSLFPNGNFSHWIFSTAKESPVDFEMLRWYILRSQWQKALPPCLVLGHLINRSFFLDCVLTYQFSTWNGTLRIISSPLLHSASRIHIFRYFGHIHKWKCFYL